MWSRSHIHLARSAGSARLSASRMPRSRATQFITFEYTKCSWRLRISQIPASRSCQFSQIHSSRSRIFTQTSYEEIGRASCRERVEIAEVGGEAKKKE